MPKPPFRSGDEIGPPPATEGSTRRGRPISRLKRPVVPGLSCSSRYLMATRLGDRVRTRRCSMSRRSRSRRRERSIRVNLPSISVRSGAVPISTALRLVRRPRPVPLGLSGRVMSAPRRGAPYRMSTIPLGRVRQMRNKQFVSRITYTPFHRNPRLPARLSPCVRRASRKSVLFSLGVAGRGWSRGGPNMRFARRTVESGFTCRR